MLALLMRLLLWALALALIVLWLLAAGIVWLVEAVFAWRRKTPMPRPHVPRGTSDAKFGRTAGVAAAIVVLLAVIGGSGSGSNGAQPASAEATSAATTEHASTPVKARTTEDSPSDKAKRKARAARRAAKARAERRAAKARAERRRKREAAVRRQKERKAAAAKEEAAAAKPTCDTSYEGACLDPSASDYDCLGGSGDGPKYTGRVTVVGDDHFDLDRDGDGIGCQAS